MGKDKRRNITNKPVPYGFNHEENTENNTFDGSHFEPYIAGKTLHYTKRAATTANSDDSCATK